MAATSITERNFVGGVAGGEHDRVGRVVATVGGAHAVVGDLDDRVGDELDLVTVEGVVVVGRDQGPLGADRHLGRQAPAELGVVHPGEVLQTGLVHGGDHDGIVDVPRRSTRRALSARTPLTDRCLGVAGGAAVGVPLAVVLGEHPVRRALVDVEVRHVGGDRRDHLDGTGCRPDHGDPFAVDEVGATVERPLHRCGRPAPGSGRDRRCPGAPAR